MKGQLSFPQPQEKRALSLFTGWWGFTWGFLWCWSPEFPSAVAGCPFHWVSQYWSKLEKKNHPSHACLHFPSPVRSDWAPPQSTWSGCRLLWGFDEFLMSQHCPVSSQSCLRAARGTPSRRNGRGVVPNRRAVFHPGRAPSSRHHITEILVGNCFPSPDCSFHVYKIICWNCMLLKCPLALEVWDLWFWGPEQNLSSQ